MGTTRTGITRRRRHPMGSLLRRHQPAWSRHGMGAADSASPGEARADRAGPYRLKRPCDLLVASVALLVLAPLLALIGLAVLLLSGWPVLYRAGRLGHRGRIFT